MGSLSNKLFGNIQWSEENVKSISGYFSINPMIVYTNALSHSAINIFHAHFPSIGEFPTLDAKYLTTVDIEKCLDEFRKETDDNSNDIKYRVIIEKENINQVLYSYKGIAGVVNYVENKFEVGEIINLEPLNIPQMKYGRIQSIPISVTAVLDPAAEVMETSPPQHELLLACRYKFVESMPGYMDIEIIPDTETKPGSFKEISIPVCLIKKDNQDEGKKWVNDKLITWSNIHRTMLYKISKKTEEAIMKYKTISNDLDKMKLLLEEYKDIEGELIAFPDDNLTSEEAVIYIKIYIGINKEEH